MSDRFIRIEIAARHVGLGEHVHGGAEVGHRFPVALLVEHGAGAVAGGKQHRRRARFLGYEE